MAAAVRKRLWSRILESSSMLSKILATMKHYKKMFLIKVIFRKSFFSLFWFSLKQILGSERKHLSHHRLLVSFVIPLAHDMEYGGFKMLIMLKFLHFITRLLDFMFCLPLSSHSTSENHSCTFSKFPKSMTNTMRICLLWALFNIIPLWKL